MLTPFGQALAALLLLVNAAGFLAFGWDKWRAKRSAWRTPEKTLALFALAGGWVGTWAGVKVFRHKSSKRSFQVKLILATSGNLALWVLAWQLGWLSVLVDPA